MKKLIFLSLIFLCFISQFAFADSQYSLVINGFSKHFDVNQTNFPNGLNEKNYGFGVEYNFDKNATQTIEWVLNTGFFKDSLNGTAFYGGGAGLVKLCDFNPISLKVGLEGSLFYSSEYNQGKPFLAVFPIINIGTDRYSLNIAIIPRIQQFIDAGVIFAQIKVGI
jgi:hypothetical protein